MTKYILHGGYTREENFDTDSFYREWTKGLDGKIKILLCYFAEFRDHYFDEDNERLLENSRNKNFELEIADADNFRTQIKNSDVVYFRGGSITKLLSVLRNFPNLKSLLSGRIVIGSSAGTYALSKYYWNNDKKEIQDGLGILNIKSFCHYKDEDKENMQKLAEYKEDLPIITLPDYKWVTIYK